MLWIELIQMRISLQLPAPSDRSRLSLASLVFQLVAALLGATTQSSSSSRKLGCYKGDWKYIVG